MGTLVDVFQVSPDSLDGWLIGDGLVEADGVGDGGAFRGTDEPKEARFQDGGDADIGECDAFGDEEGAGREVGFQEFEGTGVAFTIKVVKTFVVWKIAIEEVVDDSTIRENFVLRKGDPLVNLGRFF